MPDFQNNEEHRITFSQFVLQEQHIYIYIYKKMCDQLYIYQFIHI